MQLEEIAGHVVAGTLTPKRAHVLAYAMGHNPDELIIPCEAPGCTVAVPFGKAHSIILHYATTGASGVKPFQCDNQQHFGCTPAHAIAAAMVCLREHLLPSMAGK